MWRSSTFNVHPPPHIDCKASCKGLNKRVSLSLVLRALGLTNHSNRLRQKAKKMRSRKLQGGTGCGLELPFLERRVDLENDRDTDGEGLISFVCAVSKNVLGTEY